MNFVIRSLLVLKVKLVLIISIELDAEGGFSLDLRSADKELKAVTPEK